MKDFLEDIGNYMQFKEFVISLLLTGVFLLLSYVGHTRFSTTEITAGGITHIIHISYYGFPYTMVGILNPITEMEYYWVYQSGGGLVRIIWGGLFLNGVLYFLLAFALVYSLRRLKG